MQQIAMGLWVAGAKRAAYHLNEQMTMEAKSARICGLVIGQRLTYRLQA